MQVYFAMNGKGCAERILQFELYPPLCIYNVEFHSQREHSWVVSECLNLPEMSGLWNFSVRVQSWSDKIESDPVLIHKIFENHQSDPVLIRQCKIRNVYFVLMRQKNYWSDFAFSQIRLVEGKIVPAVLLPHETKQTQPVGIAKVW